MNLNTAITGVLLGTTAGLLLGTLALFTVLEVRRHLDRRAARRDYREHGVPSIGFHGSRDWPATARGDK